MSYFLINQNFLICLVGLPSSGKSTFANLLKIVFKERFSNLDAKIIDPDIIRNKLTPEKFDYEKEYIVRNENLKMIKKELEKGNIVISDDLNYYSSMRHDLKDIAENLKKSFFIIHIATPIEICLKWNEGRGEPIPNEVIRKVQEKFDNFNKYKWDYPIATYDLSELVDVKLKIKQLVDNLENKITIMNRERVLEENFVISKIHNENLDKITRKYVGKLVLNTKFLHLKKKIIKLRKLYVKNNKNIAQSQAKILKNFRKYLEKSLNIKISENFFN
jgi:tRNA uridine 5-carbamoylmethylation protein Kti12